MVTYNDDCDHVDHKNDYHDDNYIHLHVLSTCRCLVMLHTVEINHCEDSWTHSCQSRVKLCQVINRSRFAHRTFLGPLVAAASRQPRWDPWDAWNHFRDFSIRIPVRCMHLKNQWSSWAQLETPSFRLRNCCLWIVRWRNWTSQWDLPEPKVMELLAADGHWWLIVVYCSHFVVYY